MTVRLSRHVNLLVIHHSASPRSTTRDQIEHWHRSKGWNSIGYHFVLDANAALLQGREMGRAGAHAKGHNTHSVGICVVGDNTRIEHAWTSEQKIALASFVRWFRTFFPLADVLGHRDLSGSATLCPGIDVRALLTELGAL